MRQNDQSIPAEALCVVQPFHPGVLNLLYPYAPTLAKQRALKKRLQKKPSWGRYERSWGLAGPAYTAVPIVCGAWNLTIPVHGASNLS